MDDREKAAKELNCDPNFVDHYSFPKVFGSTAGPSQNVGGQTLTTFQIDAYTNNYKTVFFCMGKRIKCVKGWFPDIDMP